MINRFFSAIASALQQLFGVIIASPLEERRFVSKSVATGLFLGIHPDSVLSASSDRSLLGFGEKELF